MYFTPKMLSNWQLYNNCIDKQEPDWSKFTQLELRPLRQGPSDCSVLPEEKAHLAAFWTVYARNRDGLAEAITDIFNEPDIKNIVRHLSIRSGLPLQ